jgi:hypothetical protein
VIEQIRLFEAKQLRMKIGFIFSSSSSLQYKFIFFFTFPYKLFQLYITSILIFNYSKEKTQGEERIKGFQTGPLIKRVRG